MPAGAGSRTWTHIVVGGGTAGCVVAARLSEQPELRVLLLEAGGRPLDPCLHVPLGLMGISYRRHSWQYGVAADESRAGAREVWPAGRALGGTSVINGMLWSRGARADYDAWAAHGLDGWGYDDVLRCFLKGERVGGGRPARGAGGPVQITTSACREPLAREFLDSAQAAGHAVNEDYNGGQSLGVAPMQVARSRRLRQSSYSAYLAHARRRPNLRVERRAQVSRIIVSGKRAVGVEYEQGRRGHRVHCSGEVILCAGAIGSPALLMRSGLGPADHLSACRIPVVADIAGVGGNLRNHPLMAMVFEVSRPTLNMQTSLPHLLAEAGRYLAGRECLFTTAPSHVIVYSAAGGNGPGCSISYGAYGATQPGSGAMRRFARPMRGNRITLRIQLFGSDSRGTVRLRPAAPQDRPAIHYTAFGGSHDAARMTAACRQARTITQSPPLSRFVVRELTPGPDVRSDEDWDAALRRLVSSGRHYGGTCAMGLVVDAELRVSGLRGLRVADASVMPELPSGGLYAPTVMIAERAAELITAPQRGADLQPAADRGGRGE
jgi:choline dehydrogenase